MGQMDWRCVRTRWERGPAVEHCRLHGNPDTVTVPESTERARIVIVSFADQATEDPYHNRPTARARRFPPDTVAIALVKLDMLNATGAVRDLGSPPGNRLEALRGQLAGRHSIRLNDQWRLVLRWGGNNAHDVGLTDYHG
jgi:proteic killer suppression protein